MAEPPAQPKLPQFAVRLAPPDIDPWREGNGGVPGFTTLASGAPGPHVGVLALTHGNEISGAIVLDRLLRSGFTPLRGMLTVGFVNLAAFDLFDPQQPTLSRFVDEDINRVWDESVLDGPRASCELKRARQIRPMIERFDIMLDLHSMLWPSDPVMLCGSTDKGRRLAHAIGRPALIVGDHGHAGGRRIIDYARFVDAETRVTANLLEAGQHWEPDSVAVAEAAVAGLLQHAGMNDAPIPEAPSPRFAAVTEAVTACSGSFAFLHPYRGGDIVTERDTLIAMDDAREIRTPYADCLLVMPSLRPSRGQMAVRLARFSPD